MKKSFLFILCSTFLLSISACSKTKKIDSFPNTTGEAYVTSNGEVVETVDFIHQEDMKPHGEYNEGTVLVKTSSKIDISSLDLKIESIKELFPNSEWKIINLADGTTYDAVQYLRTINTFEKVDYDYVMAPNELPSSLGFPNNTLFTSERHLEPLGVYDTWSYQFQNSISVGGSRDVVVAVIDTGVDYNHIDLRNNIWINSAEIPNNGIDDDNNGYVDDIRGWDFVSEDNDPIDDNGHGTHVAGIIASENNSIGVVGIAFNCRIMCIKAGNSSGYFTNSDIAEAIQYAYMNGASVINMSFGGTSISNALKDALEDAYNQCVLVAAAGNDGLSNEPSSSGRPFYPAALTYVIGVMSNDYDYDKSLFTNYDPIAFNQYEYEIYSFGEQIISTWPNNKYAVASGTSMAAPTVSATAALLRSLYSNQSVYSTKFIQSQIVNNGIEKIGGHYCLNVFNALTHLPKPNLHLFNYYTFEKAEYGLSNNGDGIIDAGETIKVGIELFNYGGVASNLNCTLNTYRNNDPSLLDPYLTVTDGQMTLGDVGTYSKRDGTKIYDGDLVVGMEKTFEIEVASNAPNSYVFDLNVVVSYKNGLDSNDTTNYSLTAKLPLSASNGIKLPKKITEDITFTADKLYILSNTMTIESGVNVVFEAGAKIQFYEQNSSYLESIYNSPSIMNYGNLTFNGNSSKHVEIFPSELFESCICGITNDGGNCTLNYCDAKNISLINTTDGGGSINCSYCNFDDYGNGLYSYTAGATNAIARGLTFEGCALSHCLVNFYSPNNVSNFSAISCYFYIESQCGLSPKGQFKFNVVYAVTSKPDVWGNHNGFGLGNCDASNNVFITDSNDVTAAMVPSIGFSSNPNSVNNTFLGGYKIHGEVVISGYNGDLDYESSDYSDLFPFVKSITLYDESNRVIRTVGKERVTVQVEFSKSMDTSVDAIVSFGSIKPFRDYLFNGDYVSSTIWRGEYELKSFIENGSQHFSVSNAISVDNEPLVPNAKSFGFDIDTTSALSMSMQAFPGDDGIELSWVQDDYDTLMGYNIYRSGSKDGNYVKINQSIIPAGENTFVDDSVEPGKTYWYTFTVVLSDFSESAPAGKISVMSKDTISPVIYHTPVNQGYAGNNLVINCSVSDNLAVQSATLFYRTIGDLEWKSLTMSKANSRYSATIFGSEVTMDGLEYYISATDGVNTVTRGSAESPFTVIVKDPSLLNNLGDVDGDGVITTKDALMIVKALAGEIILSDDQFQRADLNKDGNLSAAEALRILQYVNGNVTTLEM